jgi:hypothetical protein
VLDLERRAGPATPGAYALLGAGHIVHSAERVGFLLGLMLLVRRRRDWLIAGAALCCGYLASLLTPACDLIPQMPLVESALGLLVTLCAAHWVSMRMRAPRGLARIIAAALAVLALALASASALAAVGWSGEAAWSLLGAALFSGGLLVASAYRPAVALFVLPLLFAVLDGQVLWGDYTRLHLWRSPGPATLLAFDAGALLVELGIMALLYGGAVWWVRSRRRASFNNVAEELAATALAGLGAFWLLIQIKGS